jgi:tetratricopeptide (TPR) repeat protein
VRAGDVVADRFEVESVAGEGGMATVYRARDRDRGEVVALKVLRSVGDAAFLREAQLLAHIVHPGIVRCIAFGKMDDGRAYIATEWLEGQTLRRKLASGPLPVSEAVDLARRGAEALAAAHQWGVVHRDVTPANILVLGGGAVKLLDFGIAHAGFAPSSTVAGLGTPGYLSPEQARGDARIDPRADVFSLGCVLYECLSGRRPFEAEHSVAALARVLFDEVPRLRELRADVPRALDALVARMLSKEPEARPADGAAVAAELASLAIGDAAPPPASSTSRAALGEQETRTSSVVVGWIGADARDEIVPRLPERVRIEWLPNGAMVAMASGREGSATENAVVCARIALALARARGDARAAVATGRTASRAGDGEGFGDAARRAAELAKAAPGGVALVDEPTAGLLGDRFELGPFAVGLELLRETINGPRTLLGRDVPCVGRDREIGLVLGTAEECFDEQVARVVLLLGPAGIGKSRVREEVVGRLRAFSPRPVAWIARGDPTRSGNAMGLVAQLIASACAIEADDPPEVRGRKIVDRAALHVPLGEVPRVVEFLGVLVRGATEAPSLQLRAAREDPILMGDQLKRAVEDFVLAELRAGPVAMILEDLQWGDAASVRAIDALLARARDLPLFVLALGRPEARDAFPRLWAQREPLELALGALAPKSVAQVVRAALGEVPEGVVEALVERSGGNPFTLEELVRAHASGATSLPDSVIAMLQARIGALEPEARRVLRAASVFGRAFEAEGVLALLGDGVTREQVAAWLEWLGSRELVSRRGAAFAFRHALVRDAAYAMLTDDDRALGHRLAAAWLARSGASDAWTLAAHHEAGHDTAAAARSWAAAAWHALEVSDLGAAAERAARARALAREAPGAMVDEGAMWLIEAEARRWRGEYADAERCAAAALEALAPGGVRWFQAAAELVTAAGSRGNRDDVARVAALVGDALARVDPADAAFVAAVVAVARAALQLTVLGEFRRGDELLGRLAALALPEDALLARGRVQQALATRAAMKPDPGAYVRHTREAVEAFARAGDARNACVQESTLGFALLEVGAVDEARSHLERALGVAEAMGLRAVVATARHALGIAALRGGDAATAVLLQKQAELDLRGRNARLEGGAHMQIALAMLACGELEAARAHATRAVELLCANPPSLAPALAVLSQVRRGAGEVAAALDAATEAMMLLGRLGGLDTGEAKVRLAHGEAMLAAGRDEEARAALAAARRRLEEIAARIDDETLRRGFLERVPDHVRTLELAQSLGA